MQELGISQLDWDTNGWVKDESEQNYPHVSATCYTNLREKGLRTTSTVTFLPKKEVTATRRQSYVSNEPPYWLLAINLEQTWLAEE